MLLAIFSGIVFCQTQTNNKLPANDDFMKDVLSLLDSAWKILLLVGVYYVYKKWFKKKTADKK